MGNFHVAVWIDHNEAKVFHIDEASFTESTLACKTARGPW